jgi:hypothetical protein
MSEATQLLHAEEEAVPPYPAGATPPWAQGYPPPVSPRVAFLSSKEQSGALPGPCRPSNSGGGGGPQECDPLKVILSLP